MKSKYKNQIRCLAKAAICLAFIGSLTIKCKGGLPPKIIVQPLGLAVQNGGIAVLTTTAALRIDTITTFQWLFNGQPVSTTNTIVISLLGVSTLTINNVSPASAGNYSVRVTNGNGSLTSDTAALVILTDTVSTTLSNVVSFVSAETGMVTSGFKLKMSGPIGSNLVIEATSDMKNWTPICTNLISNGGVTYTDAVAKTLPSRYYRAKIQ